MSGALERRAIAGLVRRAQSGDAAAWAQLVEGLRNLVWSVVRGFRLADADAEDATQMTWLRAVEKLDSVRDPDRFGLWLATIARRECLRHLQRTDRFVSVAIEDWHLEDEEAGCDIADPVVDSQEAARVIEHLMALPEQCVQLLRLLLCDPPFKYDEIAELLGIAVGTIGPRRQRCLKQLRASMEAWVPDSG